MIKKSFCKLIFNYWLAYLTALHELLVFQNARHSAKKRVSRGEDIKLLQYVIVSNKNTLQSAAGHSK